jgi:hypothetical protein
MGLVHLVLSKAWVLSSTSSAWVVTVLVARRDGEVVPVFFPSSSPSFFFGLDEFFFQIRFTKIQILRVSKNLKELPTPRGFSSSTLVDCNVANMHAFHGLPVAGREQGSSVVVESGQWSAQFQKRRRQTCPFKNALFSLS